MLLICLLPLLCEGLLRIFEGLEDVDLVCMRSFDSQQLEDCLGTFHPVMVLLAGEKEDDSATHLISDLLRHCADIPIVWIELETNVLRIYTSHIFPASSADLINAIRNNEIHPLGIYPQEPKSQSGSQGR